MSFFQPKTVIDPATGKKRVINPEEQWKMLEKGVLFDLPIEEDSKKVSDKSTQDTL